MAEKKTKFETFVEDVQGRFDNIDTALKSKPPKPSKDEAADLKLLRENNETRFSSIETEVGGLKELFDGLKSKTEMGQNSGFLGDVMKFLFEM